MTIEFLRGCKPFIGVDGCFLEGPFKGVLLVAIRLDRNNGDFSLACGVVDKENKNNWAHFFKIFRICLGNEEIFKLSFISDRHKVILFV